MLYTPRLKRDRRETTKKQNVNGIHVPDFERCARSAEQLGICRETERRRTRWKSDGGKFFRVLMFFLTSSSLVEF